VAFIQLAAGVQAAIIDSIFDQARVEGGRIFVPNINPAGPNLEDFPDDCVIPTTCTYQDKTYRVKRNAKGYAQFKPGRDMRAFSVHTEVCRFYHGPRPEGHEASHLCHRHDCCNPRHLLWETVANNRARNNCTVWTICGHCGETTGACLHLPLCIARDDD
jgi:hypothetical protein